MFVHHAPIGSTDRAPPPVFHQRTQVSFPQQETITVGRTVAVGATGKVDGVARDAVIILVRGNYTIAAGSHLVFPAGSRAPSLQSDPIVPGRQWDSPLIRLSGHNNHPLAATYGILLATVLRRHRAAAYPRAVLHQP